MFSRVTMPKKSRLTTSVLAASLLPCLILTVSTHRASAYQMAEKGFVYCPAYPCVCEAEEESGGLAVNCQYLYLTQLPKFLAFDGRIRTMSLRQNSIRQLPARAFLGLRVQSIDLTENVISHVDDEAFEGLEDSLEELRLQLYAMDGLPSTALSRLRKLKVLKIIGGKADTLGSSSFQGLDSLQELYLQGCRIKDIADGGLATLKRLQVLSLSGNLLHSHHLVHLAMLYQLQKLVLSRNRITHLPDNTFQHLLHLKHLDMSENNLTTVDADAFKPLHYALEVLHLNDNRLTNNVFQSLRHLRNLRHLVLSGNRITALPAGSLKQLEFLGQLELSENFIRELEAESLRGTERFLQVLKLDSNPLALLRPNTFLNHTRLWHLALDNTRLGASSREQPQQRRQRRRRRDSAAEEENSPHGETRNRAGRGNRAGRSVGGEIPGRLEKGREMSLGSLSTAAQASKGLLTLNNGSKESVQNLSPPDSRQGKDAVAMVTERRSTPVLSPATSATTKTTMAISISDNTKTAVAATKAREWPTTVTVQVQKIQPSVTGGMKVNGETKTATEKKKLEQRPQPHVRPTNLSVATSKTDRKSEKAPNISTSQTATLSSTTLGTQSNSVVHRSASTRETPATSTSPYEQLKVVQNGKASTSVLRKSKVESGRTTVKIPSDQAGLATPKKENVVIRTKYTYKESEQENHALVPTSATTTTTKKENRAKASPQSSSTPARTLTQSSTLDSKYKDGTTSSLTEPTSAKTESFGTTTVTKNTKVTPGDVYDGDYTTLKTLSPTLNVTASDRASTSKARRAGADSTLSQTVVIGQQVTAVQGTSAAEVRPVVKLAITAHRHSSDSAAARTGPKADDRQSELRRNLAETSTPLIIKTREEPGRSKHGQVSTEGRQEDTRPSLARDGLFTNGNGEPSLTMETFRGLGRTLTKLSLSGANLTDLDLLAVANLHALEDLDVSRNLIASVPRGVFRRLQRLKKLDLSRNGLENLQDDAFRGLEATLESVDLHGNGIKAISHCVFERFQRLGDLRLQSNPLHCDCQLGWLYDWLHLSLPDYHRALLEWRCASPRPLAARLFGTLTLAELQCPDVTSTGNGTRALPVCDSEAYDDPFEMEGDFPAVGNAQPSPMMPSDLLNTHLAVDVLLLNPGEILVKWNVSITSSFERNTHDRSISAFRLLLRRANDSWEEADVTVGAEVTQYLFDDLLQSFLYEVCVTAFGEEAVPVSRSCVEAVTSHNRTDQPEDFSESWSTTETSTPERKQQDEPPVAWTTLLWAYVSGCLLATALCVALVLLVRRRRMRLRQRRAKAGLGGCGYQRHAPSLHAPSLHAPSLHAPSFYSAWGGSGGGGPSCVGGGGPCAGLPVGTGAGSRYSVPSACSRATSSCYFTTPSVGSRDNDDDIDDGYDEDGLEGGFSHLERATTISCPPTCGGLGAAYPADIGEGYLTYGSRSLEGRGRRAGRRASTREGSRKVDRGLWGLRPPVPGEGSLGSRRPAKHGSRCSTLSTSHHHRHLPANYIVTAADLADDFFFHF